MIYIYICRVSTSKYTLMQCPGPVIPTLEEFRMFFLYIGYDIISEKGCCGVEQQQQQAYKKFVNNNKEVEWAQQLLQAVSCVQNAKNHYKTLLPMLLSRNMTSLHRVCTDITSSNVVPHKEVHGFERCCITGIWHERCIDVSKGSRSVTTLKSLSIQQQSAEDDAVSSDKSSRTTINGGGCIFISPKFLHFSQMLWTMAKIDVVIKNYTIMWLQAHANGATSMQQITCKFDEMSQDFVENLYKVFIHAVEHVCDSLVSHMYNPLFSSCSVPSSSTTTESEATTESQARSGSKSRSEIG
jgi:hypothetical protein